MITTKYREHISIAGIMPIFCITSVVETVEPSTCGTTMLLKGIMRHNTANTATVVLSNYTKGKMEVADRV